MRVYDKDGNVVYPFQWHNALRDSDLSQDMLFFPVSSGERLREMRRERTLRSSRRGSRVWEILAVIVLFMLAMVLFAVADLE